MKMFLRFSIFLLVLLTGSRSIAADRFAVANGTWDATTTWSAARGGASGASVPSATDTVYIPGPYMVTLTASGKNCYNIIIDSGGVLISDSRNPNANQRYLRVAGNFVQNDGIIGYDPVKGPDSTTSLCFEANGEGKTVTFKGKGISKISRIRNGSTVSNTTVIIDQDITLTYNGTSGTGGVAWYPQSGTNHTLIVKTGRKLTVVDQGTIATASSVDTDGPKTTIQIDGSLLMQGQNSTISLRPMKDSVVTFIVNGTVDLGRTFKPTGKTNGDPSNITVNATGVLKVGTAGVGIVYFHSPNQTVKGAGTFTLGANSTMHIGSPFGLDPVSGPIRTTTRNLNNGNKFEFFGSSAAMVTGPDFPAKIQSLTLNDTTGTLTLTNSLTIDTALVLNFGKLLTGSKFAALGPAAIISGASASNFVDGALKLMVASAGVKKWAIGQGTDYLPFTGSFSAVGGSDYITVQANEATVTPPAGPVNVLSKMLKHYFRVAKGSALTAVTTDSLVLGYSRADVAAQGLTPELLKVFRYDGLQWVPAAIKNLDTASNSITITITSAIPSGDYAFASALVTPPAAAFPEDFNYPAGDTLTSRGWVISSGGTTNAILTTSPGLIFENYGSSGIGNAAALTTTGQDVFKNFAADSTGSLYASFMVNVTIAQATGDYFFALSQSSAQTNYYSRLFIKSVTGGYSFGLSKNNETPQVYGSTVFSFNTTYLVVVKYAFNTGSITDDEISVHVLAARPVPYSEEPATPEIGAYSNATKNDAANLGIVTLRQGTATNAPGLVIDGIRVDSSWKGVLGISSNTAYYSVGTGNIPGEQGHFASMKAAFDTLSRGFAFTGDNVFYITSDINEPETGGIGIGIACDPSPYSVIFKPYVGVKPTITFAYPSDGNSGPSGASFIGLNSAAMAWADLKKTRNIIFDGSNTTGGVSRDLTFQTSTSANRNAITLVIVGDASAITVKNCNIHYKVAAVSTSGNLMVSALLIRTATVTNTGTVEKVPSNLIIDNNNINANFAGVCQSAQGLGGYGAATQVGYPSNIIIRNNKIEGKRRAISLYLLGSTDLYGNEIILNQSIADGLANEAIYGISTLAAATYNIYNNKISSVASINSTAATAGVAGISIEAAGTFNIYNNMIYGFALNSANANKSAYVYGIKDTSSLATVNIFFNTIQMDTLASIGTGTVNYRGIFVSKGTNSVKNNIIVNNEDDFASFNMYRPNSGTAGVFSGTMISNYNDFYRAGSVNAKIGFFDTVACADLAAWKSASGQDANSVSGPAPFVSATDLHMNPAATPVSVASKSGTPIIGIRTDIDGDFRDPMRPDMGADEYIAKPLVMPSSVALATQKYSTSVTNTGHIGGLTTYQVPGPGFLFAGSDRLFEGSFLISNGAKNVSNSVRLRNGDWSPGFKQLTDVGTSKFGASKFTVTSYDDSNMPRPLGVKVLQQTISDTVGNYMMIRLNVVNTTAAAITNLLIGSMFDFDMTAAGNVDRGAILKDTTNTIQGVNGGAPFKTHISYMQAEGVNNFVGLVPLSQTVFTAARIGINPTEIYPAGELTDTMKYDYISKFRTANTYTDGGVKNDLCILSSVGPFSVGASGTDTAKAAFGIVVGTSLAELIANARLVQKDFATMGFGVRFTTGVSKDVVAVPKQYSMEQNYPNPFNPTTTIRYSLPVASRVTLKIYNVIGEEVATLVSGMQDASSYSIVWNGRSSDGITVASGVYFYRIAAESQDANVKPFVEVKKMLMIK